VVTPRYVGPAIALAVVFFLGILLHLEMRASSQAAQLAALRIQLSSLPLRQGQPEAQTPPSPVVRVGVDPETAAAIARAVEAQLQASRGSAALAADAGAEHVPPVRTVAQETAFADCEDTATHAIAVGRLSRDDVMRMRSDLSAALATDAERDAIRSKIAVAINARRLKPDDPHFIYP
jgi:hypothetical protein